ncbi:hypothetical protein WMY93_002103 [Mugilogobius chulae]|uniref:Phosphatidylcholine transfer protein n=1 Tax=Mugilogobius chulae TaxID=88201 RepID=A0AAW0PW75_9GOBI
MALHFTDEDFQAAWKELDEPQLEGGWELFTETMGVKIYRRYDQTTGLYEYKVFGVLSTCPADLCADVYMDLNYRKHWDSYVKELDEKDFDDQRAIYWEVNTPFLCPTGTYPSERKNYVTSASAETWRWTGGRSTCFSSQRASDNCAEKSGVIRVNDYKQSLAIESDGGTGTKSGSLMYQKCNNVMICVAVFMNYFDNPGGSIPTWLINWAAKSGVPGFLKDMQKACNNYKSYSQKK